MINWATEKTVAKYVCIICKIYANIGIYRRALLRIKKVLSSSFMLVLTCLLGVSFLGFDVRHTSLQTHLSI